MAVTGRQDGRTYEPCPGCEHGRRKATQALCQSCWHRVPRHLRSAFWRTTPYSAARQAVLVDIYRHVIESRG